MKKKIKKLTKKEMDKICAEHTAGTFPCCESLKCPLWFASCCLKGFIDKMQYIEREVEIDE